MLSAHTLSILFFYPIVINPDTERLHAILFSIESASIFRRNIRRENVHRHSPFAKKFIKPLANSKELWYNVIVENTLLTNTVSIASGMKSQVASLAFFALYRAISAAWWDVPNSFEISDGVSVYIRWSGISNLLANVLACHSGSQYVTTRPPSLLHNCTPELWRT